jgi:hypothetical protein
VVPKNWVGSIGSLQLRHFLVNQGYVERSHRVVRHEPGQATYLAEDPGIFETQGVDRTFVPVAVVVAALAPPRPRTPRRRLKDLVDRQSARTSRSRAETLCSSALARGRGRASVSGTPLPSASGCTSKRSIRRSREPGNGHLIGGMAAAGSDGDDLDGPRRLLVRLQSADDPEPLGPLSRQIKTQSATARQISGHVTLPELLADLAVPSKIHHRLKGQIDEGVVDGGKRVKVVHNLRKQGKPVRLCHSAIAPWFPADRRGGLVEAHSLTPRTLQTLLCLRSVESILDVG